MPKLPDISGSYDRYIASGLYDRRYPHPNRRTLGKMKRCLPAGGRFLDVGAGTGRYTLPLLQVKGTRAVAHDICPVARKTLAERLGKFVGDERLVIRGDDMDALAADHPRAFDLGLLAFGVLAHIARRKERLHLLRAIRSMLKADGTLILSVPNARRRFRAEQRTSAPLVHAGTLEPGDILYKRGQDNGEIRLFYHLYTLPEVRGDLAEAGFRVTSVRAESLLSERAVVRDPLVGWLDAAACRVALASMGYDLLAIARP
ncbi:MAG: methyltransferase domain-containing protein [Rhodospirillales bacterium]|nr:methyltransferase domain-containing protein [Rhodospirillales bacterium]MDE0380789.1 methyltransferase domain-containing protein [Rhodospirillales bacterium]